MKRTRHEQPGLVERGLRWDTRFNCKLGVAATVAAFGMAAVAAPAVVVTGTALFAGGNFAAAELSKRAGDYFETRRTMGKIASKDQFARAA